MTPPQPGEIQIEDQLERRIRKPVDLLRCVLSCIEIVALVLAGIAARATTAAVQADIVGASRQIPLAVLTLARSLALVALFILPVALAVQLLVRRQWRRLAEAVATGALAAGLTAVANELLSREPASQLYDAIIMSHQGTSHIPALDPAVAGLVGYATMVGLVGRPAWRNALWVAVGVYSVVHVVLLHTPMLTLLITVIAGRAIGLAVRYVAGSTSQRPSAREIAAALTATNLPVTAIRRVRHEGNGVGGSRHYTVADRDGTRLDVVVYDRDQQAAGAVYRVYRSVRLLAQVPRNAPLSVDRAVEHRALLSYAAEDAGAPTPRLRALVRVGPEAAALAYEHHEGTTLAQQNPGCSDAELGQIWDAVDRLHAQHVTHRGLTADRILLTDDGQAMLLDPGDGDVAASDLQVRLDLAQLIAELALHVGANRSADMALEKAGADEMLAVVPLLQPVALARSTRKALRHHRDVLPALRTRLLAAAPGGEVAPVQLERIRLRTLVTLVASVAAVYLLAGELAKASLGGVLRSANWHWGIAALALSATTYVGATISLSGFVAERLPFFRTMLAQVAGSFVTLVTPAAVGGAALNIRFLQRRKIPAAVAAASVGVAQVVAFVLHILLILIFAAIAGTSAKESDPAADVGLVRAGRAGRGRARVVRGSRRAAGAARAGVADIRPGAAAAARGRPAPAQARAGHRGRVAAQPVLHLVPGRLRRGVRTVGADRGHRRGLPDRQRHRLHLAHARRPGRGGGRADRRAHRRRPAGRGRGQRGPAVPAADVLAPGPVRVGRAELSGAQASPVTPGANITRLPPADHG